jgi:hypothetical protein
MPDHNNPPDNIFFRVRCFIVPTDFIFCGEVVPHQKLGVYFSHDLMFAHYAIKGIVVNHNFRLMTKSYLL